MAWQLHMLSLFAMSVYTMYMYTYFYVHTAAAAEHDVMVLMLQGLVSTLRC